VRVNFEGGEAIGGRPSGTGAAGAERSDHRDADFDQEVAMLTSYARTSVALALLLSVALMPLAGCDYIEQQTGLNKDTQTGALSGAAFGGIVAALADANPAWIAASIIMGGVTGGAIGNYLGKDDAQKHVATNLHALDTLGQGQTSSWSNAQTGNYGSTTVTSVTTRADGAVCKAYSETVHTKAETVTKEATACKVPGHAWKIQTV
jgi:surface antigen